MKSEGRISRRFTFSAAHSINNPKWSDAENSKFFGKCSNVHGHNYVLWVHACGPIAADTGMITNITDLKRITESVLAILDHGNVNNVIVSPLGTTEMLAKWIHDQLIPHLPHHLSLQIELEETENNRVFYPIQFPFIQM